MIDDDFVQRLMADASRLPTLQPKPHLVWAGVRRRRQRRLAAGAGVGCIALAGGVATGLYGGSAPGNVPRPAASATPAPTSSMWCPDPLLCFEEPGPNGWTRELQLLVAPFVTRIEAVGATSEDFGYAAPVWVPPGITVYWSGPLPAELDPIIADAAAAGVEVTHVDMPYREDELWQALRTLNRALSAEGIYFNSMGPAHDYSGIQLGDLEVFSDPTAQAYIVELAAELIGDIPVSFVHADRVTPT